jgi:hypothetical protein
LAHALSCCCWRPRCRLKPPPLLLLPPPLLLEGSGELPAALLTAIPPLLLPP